MSRFSVVGAEWCPHSRNQAEALGCDTDENGHTTCQVPDVNFVYCQDKDRKAINTENELCKKSGIKGYPAWLDNGKVSENLGGFMEPCEVPGLNDQINCVPYKAAKETCQVAQEMSKGVLAEFEAEYKAANETMMQEVKKLEEIHLKPTMERIEVAVAPFKQECMAAREQAKPQW